MLIEAIQDTLVSLLYNPIIVPLQDCVLYGTLDESFPVRFVIYPQIPPGFNVLIRGCQTGTMFKLPPHPHKVVSKQCTPFGITIEKVPCDHI